MQRLLASAGPFARIGSRLHARLYRATGGRLGRRWFGAPVMVLETVGRQSGRPRSTPVLCLRHGEDLVVVAANAGAPRPPAWWLNLRDAGEAVAVVGGERRRVRPRVAEGPERERLWAAFARMYPQIDDYTGFTDRRFPVVVLEKV
ncbi:MAG TPA: nitroreductase/quinone reductase family protein [Solirubrobacteraceae bacterium]|nr:nitroreductase/quinone reductase family protein [Solirubrobacteraceae bacterium]